MDIKKLSQPSNIRGMGKTEPHHCNFCKRIFDDGEYILVGHDDQGAQSITGTRNCCQNKLKEVFSYGVCIHGNQLPSEDRLANLHQLHPFNKKSR